MRTVILCLLALTSCDRQHERPDVYFLAGEVVRIDAARKAATIRHGPVKDLAGKMWMEGMTMEFPVKEQKDFVLLRPGLKIKAKLFQRPTDFEYWLGDVELQ